MAISDGVGDFVYEVDDKGQRHLVRSLESNRQAYIRFTNKTSRPVDVWWRDFNGERQHYRRMNPGTFYDLKTFITHAWEFTDAATGERYMVQNKPIYRPPACLGGLLYATNWNITVGVRSLRETALITAALNIKSVQEVNKLQIPRVLIDELRNLANTLHSPLLPPLNP